MSNCLYDYSLELCNGRKLPMGFFRGKTVIVSTDCWCHEGSRATSVFCGLRRERQQGEVVLIVVNMFSRCFRGDPGDEPYRDRMHDPQDISRWRPTWPAYLTAPIFPGTPIYDNPIWSFLRIPVQGTDCRAYRVAVISPNGKLLSSMSTKAFHRKEDQMREIMNLYRGGFDGPIATRPKQVVQME